MTTYDSPRATASGDTGELRRRSSGKEWWCYPLYSIVFVVLQRKSGGAVCPQAVLLSSLLNGARSTAVRLAVTTVQTNQGKRWCCPLLVLRERTMVLSSRLVFSVRRYWQAIFTAEASTDTLCVSGAIAAHTSRHQGGS